MKVCHSKKVVKVDTNAVGVESDNEQLEPIQKVLFIVLLKPQLGL